MKDKETLIYLHHQVDYQVVDFQLVVLLEEIQDKIAKSLKNLNLHVQIIINPPNNHILNFLIKIIYAFLHLVI